MLLNSVIPAEAGIHFFVGHCGHGCLRGTASLLIGYGYGNGNAGAGAGAGGYGPGSTVTRFNHSVILAEAGIHGASVITWMVDCGLRQTC